MPLRIVMQEAFPAQEVEAVRAFAREWDADADVSATYGSKSVTVGVMVVLAFVGGSFGSGFFEEAGADSYRGLKAFIAGLRARLGREARVVLEDDQGLQLIVGPSTPSDALLDLPDNLLEAAGTSRTLGWDESERAWKSSS